MANGKKATQANNYVKTRAELQRGYRRVANIQHDIVQEFTTMLVNNYDRIVSEDLAAKQMQMSHVASKGLHRSMFGYFKQVLKYKCKWVWQGVNPSGPLLSKYPALFSVWSC